MKQIAAACALLSLFSVAGAGPAQEDEELPLWEFGLFNVVGSLPAYRGSDENVTYAVPLPYFVYRGEVIKAERDNVKGLLLDYGNLVGDLSIFVHVNENDDAREGMPELAPLLFELGPSLSYYLAGKNEAERVLLELPLRAAVSLGANEEGGLEYQGLHARFGISYVNYRPFGYKHWEIALSLGLDFADPGFNEYFYEIGEDYVRPGRPFYDAQGGYSGLSASATLLARLDKNLAVRSYVRWDNITGAVFDDSPLIRTENNLTLFIALAWMLAESPQRAAGDPW